MRARASVAALAASLALLTGCGDGGDEPGADPTPIIPSSSQAEPSPSESEAAEEEPPEMPEAARNDSSRGAEAFVRHWAAALTFALNTGNTEEVDSLAGPGCRSCEGTSDTISDVYAEGGRIKSEGWTVKQLGFGTGPANPVARIQQGSEKVWMAGKGKPKTNPAAEITLQFDLGRADEGWVIDEYEFVG